MVSTFGARAALCLRALRESSDEWRAVLWRVRAVDEELADRSSRLARIAPGVLLLACSFVTVCDKQVVFCASERDIEKSPFIVYCFARSSAGDVLVFDSCNDDCFSSESFRAMHRQYVYMIICQFVFNVLILRSNRSYKIADRCCRKLCCWWQEGCQHVFAHSIVRDHDLGGVADRIRHLPLSVIMIICSTREQGTQRVEDCADRLLKARSIPGRQDHRFNASSMDCVSKAPAFLVSEVVKCSRGTIADAVAPLCEQSPPS